MELHACFSHRSKPLCAPLVLEAQSVLGQWQEDTASPHQELPLIPARNSLQSSQAGGYSRTGLQPPPFALARATQALETSGVVTPLTSPEHF